MESLEEAILAAIQSAGELRDSTQFAGEHKVDHLKVVGVIKSLETSNMIVVKVSTIAPHSAALRQCPWVCATHMCSRD